VQYLSLYVLVAHNGYSKIVFFFTYPYHMFRYDRTVLRHNINHITYHHLFYNYVPVYACSTSASHTCKIRNNLLAKSGNQLDTFGRKFFFFLKHFSF